MKVCIIAIARQENLYIKEWVDHHLGLGFDNIIICDNNEMNGERIHNVITDERVIIERCIGIENIQKKAYTRMFLKYKQQYDWMLFIDIDEFVMLDEKYHNNIKEFLSEPIFSTADIIRLCWKIYTSNTDLDVIDNKYNVFDRFKDRFESLEDCFVKSFIRGNIKYVGGQVVGHGYYENKNLIAVASNGTPCDNTNFRLYRMKNDSVYDNAWINHYPTKTMGEYIRQKYFRGGPNANLRRYNNLSYFFKYNIKTPEKEEYGYKLIAELWDEMVKEKYKQFYTLPEKSKIFK